MRALSAAVVAVLTLSVVSGCEAPRSAGEPRPTSSTPAPQATKAAPAYLAEPKVGECHNLTLADIAAESETKKPVACTADHTTRTVAVVDAPAKALKGSAAARAYAVGQACGDGYKKALGADSKTRAKTLYSLAWFMPTKEQRADGARWMRCDVTLSDEQRAYRITGSLPLLADGATKRELRCGRDKADKETWEFVPCSVKHQYVAKMFVEASADTSYGEAKKAATAACFANRGLISWSQSEAWGVGDRWYVCWETTKQEKESNVLTLGQQTFL